MNTFIYYIGLTVILYAVNMMLSLILVSKKIGYKNMKFKHIVVINIIGFFVMQIPVVLIPKHSDKLLMFVLAALICGNSVFMSHLKFKHGKKL